MILLTLGILSQMFQKKITTRISKLEEWVPFSLKSVKLFPITNIKSDSLGINLKL